MSRTLFSLFILMGSLLASSSAYLPVVLQTETVHAQDDFSSWRSVASGDEVVALAVDPDDESLLWAATEGGGLVIWNLAQERFTQYLFPQQEGLRSNHVFDLAFDSQGYGWLATAEGVTRALPGDPVWQHWGTDEGLPDVLVHAIAVDAAGSVWAGTEAGLAVLESGAAEFIAVPAVDFEADAERLLEGPGSDRIADLETDAAGWLYVAHGRGGGGDAPALSVLDASQGGWRHIAAVAVGSSEPGPPTDQILALDMDARGRLWLGTWARGVASWDLDSDTWETYTERQDGLCSDDIWAVEALQNGIWVACGDNDFGVGVARFDGTSWQSWDVDDGLARDVVLGFAESGGRVYMATNDMGTVRPGGVGGSGIIPFDGAPREPLRTAGVSPAANDITAMVFENDGTLWVGTLDQGLLRRDPGSRTWARYTFEGTEQRMAGDTITALALRTSPTGVRELWVAAAPTVLVNGRQYIDGGVSVLNLDTGVWEYQLRSGNSSIVDDDVSSLAVDESGIVWMGFGTVSGGPGGSSANYGNGVAGYDLEKDEWYPYEYTGGDDGPAGNTVGALATGAGEIWAASSYQNEYGIDKRREGGGISVLVGNRWTNWFGGDNGFRTYHGSDTRDAAITGDVRSVVLDRDGLAWAGTYDVEVGSLVGKWPYVDAVVNGQVNANDWQSWAFEGSGWVSALTLDSQGRIWAGTTRGHYPDSAPITEYSPKGDRDRDTAVGGAYVWDGSSWTELTPWSSGIASNAITAFAVDPTTGYVWVGTENSGLSVYEQGTPWQNTPTPGSSVTPDPNATARPTQNAATATLRPSSTPAPVVATSEPGVVVTVAVPGDDDDDDDDAGREDEPVPPSEVPEAGTWFLMLLGLLAGWAFMEWQQRRRGQVV